jgi:hypothetical protein
MLTFQHVFALCNDGSVWHHTLDVPGLSRWDRLPDIPQDGEAGVNTKLQASERFKKEAGGFGFPLRSRGDLT